MQQTAKCAHCDPANEFKQTNQHQTLVNRVLQSGPMQLILLGINSLPTTLYTYE